MSSVYRNYHLTYNSVTTEITVDTANVIRTEQEKTVIKSTPTGAIWKQVFGNGKKAWAFSFTLSDRALLTFFQDAYNSAVSGYAVTLSEQEDSGAYTDYDVIINQPASTPDTIGTDPIDKNLSVEVRES